MVISESDHRKNLDAIPKNSRYRKTAATVLELARDIKRNRAELARYLQQALDKLASRRFWLDIKLGARRGHWRLVFIDPSNNMCLWISARTYELRWFPMAGGINNNPSIF